jgi:hypothetical protein
MPVPNASVPQLLASGLIGAVVTTTLNYFVRRHEARQEKRKQESRAAYVLMTWIAPTIAMKETLEKILAPASKQLEEMRREIIGPEFDDFSIAEVISIAISETLKLDPSIIASKDFSFIVELISGGGVDWKKFDITLDQIAKFPKEAIMYVSLVRQSEESCFAILQQLKLYAGDPEHQIPQHFLGVWESMNALISNSELLFSALRRFGKVSDEDADALLTHQRKRVAVFERLTNADKKKRSEELTEIISSELKEIMPKNCQNSPGGVDAS